jgi:hypothetical protein
MEFNSDFVASLSDLELQAAASHGDPVKVLSYGCGCIEAGAVDPIFLFPKEVAGTFTRGLNRARDVLRIRN